MRACRLRCTFSPCTAKCKRKDLAQHRRTACLGVPVPCSHPGCALKLNRRDMRLHVPRCDMADVSCPDCHQVRQGGAGGLPACLPRG